MRRIRKIIFSEGRRNSVLDSLIRIEGANSVLHVRRYAVRVKLQNIVPCHSPEHSIKVRISTLEFQLAHLNRDGNTIL